MRILSVKKSCAILAIGALLGSCRSSSSTGPGTTTVVTKPNAGSTFTYLDTERDSTGASTGYSSTEVHTVVQSGMTFAGKTHVMEVQTDNATEPAYINYETNGDISVYESNSGLSSIWVTYPFASQTVQQASVDTTYLQNGITTQVSGKETLTGAGTTNITVNGKSYLAEHVHVVATATISYGGVADPVGTSTEDLWFSPEIGYMLKVDSPPTKDYTGTTGTGTTSQLTSFVLQ